MNHLRKSLIAAVAIVTTFAVYDVEAASRYIRENNKAGIIVFVHGVFGDAISTWTNPSTKVYWPTLLTQDSTFDSMDIYVYEYPSPKTGRTFSINELAENMRLVLSNDGVFNHQEVIFLSHSMGGLVTRVLLLKYRDLVQKVKALYFFATPTTGSEAAQLGKLLSSNPQLGQMIHMDSETFLADLQRDWLAANLSIPSYCAYEIKATFGIPIVEQQSATNLCNKRVDPIDTNHINIVKPANEKDTSYLAFKAAFHEIYFGRPPDPPVYQKRWVRTDESGRPYFELFRVRTENRHFQPDRIVASRTQTLAHPTGRIYEVQYECTGDPCRLSHNPDGGYGIKYQVDSDGRRFTWYRKWDGDPCDETYKALYEVQTEVCVKNCPQ